MKPFRHRLTVTVASIALTCTMSGLAHAAGSGEPAADDETRDDRTIVVTGQLAAAPVAAKADIPMLENIQPISVLPEKFLGEH